MTRHQLRNLLACTLLAGSVTQSLADPLTSMLADGPQCRTRSYDQAHLDKNPGQKTRAIRVSLAADRSIKPPAFRRDRIGFRCARGL